MQLAPRQFPLVLRIQYLVPHAISVSASGPAQSRAFHRLSRVKRRVLRNREAGMTDQAQLPAEYASWTHEQLVARIQHLESQICPAAHTSSILPSPTPQTPSATPTQNDDSVPQRIPYRKPPKHPPKAFDASKYSTRLIALKFAYLGQKYNGFEHHVGNRTPLPTIEEEVWKALVKTRLINPIPNVPRPGKSGQGASEEREREEFGRLGRDDFQKWDRDGVDVNWEGCEYSKCGRTDRGVSAFGQVIGVRVRSNRPLPKAKSSTPGSPIASSEHASDQIAEPVSQQDLENLEPEVDEEVEEKPFDDTKDELPYIQLLNRVLPPDIRFYAWCPNPPPDFSARFSCKERRYKYFFTNPCFAPAPGSSSLYTPVSSTSSNSLTQMREGYLDIAAMKQACASLIGLHDFRNFCKIDASKQLTNFQRRIFHADIEEISPLSIPSFLQHPTLQNPSTSSAVGGIDQPKIYSFTLHGSAFLWHQVRSLIAILFLIGQGLEPASLVPALLDISSNPRRPKYEMASDAPLVLWDCIFPSASEVQSSEERETGYVDRLEWIYVGEKGAREPISRRKGTSVGEGLWGRGGVVEDVWEVWRHDRIQETLSGLLLDRMAGLDGGLGARSEEERNGGKVDAGAGGKGTRDRLRVFYGGDVGKSVGRYISVLDRERQESVEVVNEAYAKRKGLRAGARDRREYDGDE